MAAKEQKKPKSLQRWKLYDLSGGKLGRKNKYCPKCGQGSYMANHTNRWTCGQCNYSEFLSKSQ